MSYRTRGDREFLEVYIHWPSFVTFDSCRMSSDLLCILFSVTRKEKSVQNNLHSNYQVICLRHQQSLDRGCYLKKFLLIRRSLKSQETDFPTLDDPLQELYFATGSISCGVSIIFFFKMRAARYNCFSQVFIFSSCWINEKKIKMSFCLRLNWSDDWRQ